MMNAGIRAVAFGGLCAVLMTACAPNLPSMYKLADPLDRRICKQEVPIGSHIPALRCFTLRQLNLEADAARRQMTSDKSNKSPSR
jgi:hypothetical protein